MSLCIHPGGTVVDPEQLENCFTPPATRTWTPISHNTLLGQVKNTLSRAGWDIKNEQHALSKEGNRYFGLMDITVPSATDGDYGMTVGIRNSHDKSFPAGLCVGSHVFVCDNLAFSAEIKIARKHTRWINEDLPGLVNKAVGRLGDLRRNQDLRIAAYKQHEIGDRDTHDILIQALDAKIIGSTQLPDVLQQWRQPNHPEFKERTAWSLFNGFTEVMKSNTMLAINRTHKLHGLMDSVCNVAL